MRLRAYPRLHVSLIDLGGWTYRKYGGAGFSITGPPIEVSAHTSLKAQQVRGLALLDERARSDVLSAMSRFKELHPTPEFEVALEAIPQQHVGLGTKTALVLAVLKAADIITESRLPLESIHGLSERGGTSGVGFNLFFQGGFIVDGGQPPGSRDYGPSSAARGALLAPVVCRATIPKGWRFHLLLPRGHRISGREEVAFFQKHTPVPEIEVLKALALIYHGVAPAVLTDDLATLKSALIELHSIGFKKREMENQSDNVRSLMNSIRALPDCGVGLSSMGPLVYVIAIDRDYELEQSLRTLCDSYDADYLGNYEGRNAGFEVLE